MKKVLLFLGFTFLIYFIRFFFILDIDEIYAYGFSYNIASGLVPYKDFNMIVSPLYFLIFSIPMHFLVIFIFYLRLQIVYSMVLYLRFYIIKWVKMFYIY